MELQQITYATKIWRGDYIPALERHKNADLIIANNLGKRIVDIGEVDDPYFLPELEAVWKCQTKYILWYSADVVPPETDWVSEALPLLEHYPIVTCLWEESPHTNNMVAADFGWETYHFSDQCYLAKVQTMRDIDYNLDNSIKSFYPPHGGNSFERRVAQWLAHNKQPMAVLKNHHYHHIPQEEK